MSGPILMVIVFAGAWTCSQILPEIQLVARLPSPNAVVVGEPTVRARHTMGLNPIRRNSRTRDKRAGVRGVAGPAKSVIAAPWVEGWRCHPIRPTQTRPVP